MSGSIGSSTRSSMLARRCAAPLALHISRISARPDPHAFGLIFTPINFHRRTRPSCKRSALMVGGPCLRGSWVEKDGQTMSIEAWLLGFIPDSDPCTSSGRFRRHGDGRSCPGLCLFQDCRTLARKRLIVQPLHRSTGLRLRVPCPFMGLIHRAFRGEQAMPPTARVVWISLQRSKRSMPRRFLTQEVSRWSLIASAQVRRRRLPV